MSLEEYTTALQAAVEQLAAHSTLQYITNHPAYEEESSSELLGAHGFNTDNLPQDKQGFLNVVISNVLSQYMDQDGDKVLESAIMLDLSILLTRLCDTKAVAMHTLNTILLTTLPLDSIVDEFSKYLFGNSSRLLTLTMNNSLLGKVKPGSVLLRIGNNLVPQLYNELESHDEFSSNLRLLIQNAIDINDKLSLATDWTVNEQQGLYKEFKNSRNWPSNGNGGSGRPASAILFEDYMEFCLWLTTRTVPQLATELIPKRGDPVPTGMIRRVVRGAHECKPAPPTDESNPSSYEVDWVLDQDEFGIQIKSRRSWLALVYQVAIVCQFLSGLHHQSLEDASKGVHDKPVALPLELHTKYRSDHVRDSFVSLIKQINNDLTPSEQTALKATLDSELVWSAMKLHQFGHPDLTELANLSQSKKHKCDEYLEQVAKEPAQNRKPYFHKLGTPRLSRAWKVQTGFDQIKKGLPDNAEVIDGYDDDLYRVKGQLETADGDDKSKLDHEKSLLQWKLLRLSRNRGIWKGDI